MNAASARNLAQKLITKGGSTIPWVRHNLAPGGASGERVELSPPVTYNVIAAALGPQSDDMVASDWWRSSQVRLMVAAKGLPLTTGPSVDPKVRFEDHVTFAGTTYRVLGIEAFYAPGGAGAPVPFMYFVGLGT